MKYKNKKILVTDDEQGMRDLVVFLLEPYGIKVKTAQNGLEAVDLIKNEDFDLIFLDVHMPKMNGIEALKQIKNIKPEQIVIIFSSSSDPDFKDEEEAKRLGAFYCLYKPFTIDNLFKIMDKVMGE